MCLYFVNLNRHFSACFILAMEGRVRKRRINSRKSEEVNHMKYAEPSYRLPPKATAIPPPPSDWVTAVCKNGNPQLEQELTTLRLMLKAPR